MKPRPLVDQSCSVWLAQMVSIKDYQLSPDNKARHFCGVASLHPLLGKIRTRAPTDMEDAKMKKEVVAAEYADSDQQIHQQAAKTQNGITLVPQPSDDPQDPLVCPCPPETVSF